MMPDADNARKDILSFHELLVYAKQDFPLMLFDADTFHKNI